MRSPALLLFTFPAVFLSFFFLGEKLNRRARSAVIATRRRSMNLGASLASTGRRFESVFFFFFFALLDPLGAREQRGANLHIKRGTEWHPEIEFSLWRRRRRLITTHIVCDEEIAF